MSNRLLVTLGVLWGCAIVGGIALLLAADFTPAEAMEGPAQWPADVPLLRNVDASTLLVFVHPQCPCTRATLAELDRLLPQLDDRVDTRMIVFEPADPVLAATWRRTSLASYFERNSRVETVFDKAGVFARHFGATTSGEVFLYTASGALAFQGGITAGRGHEGGNPALDTLRRQINAPTASAEHVPVFGCSLFSDS